MPFTESSMTPAKSSLRVPFFRQRTEYTCGPRALQMVLAYYGTRVTICALLKICKAKKSTGTERKHLIAAASSFGYRVHAKNDSNISAVCSYVARGIPVIVNYRHISSEGHYAVVVGCTRTDLILNDPWYGAGWRISKQDFLKRWYGYHVNKHTRWMMAVYT